MKPMSLNLSKMKKVSGDKNSSTFIHPSGHKMVIAHNGVSAIQRKQLEKMPVHLDEGGDAKNSSSFDDTQDSAPPVTTPDESFSSRFGHAVRDGLGDTARATGAVLSPVLGAAKDFTSGVLGTDAQAAGTQSAENNERGPSPASVTQTPVESSEKPKTPPSDSSGFDLGKAYQQGQNAISEEQKVAESKAKSEAAIQEKDLADRQSFIDSFKNNAAEFQNHQKQLMNDYANSHIDPRHYIENMSTGSKIATAIGMLLGGAGAGANQPNPGMEYLNKQIERDIQAQQSRMDQQKTILGANQEAFHDQILAQNQTRVNMNDIYDHRIQLAAAKLGTPQAKAMADAAHSKFAIENAQLLQQNAIRKTVMDHAAGGGGGLSAIDLAHAGMIPQADALKEQASIDAQNAGIKQIQDLYSKLGKEQTLSNRLMNPIQSGSNIDALNAQITNAVMGADVSKRLTPESAKLEVLPFHVRLKDNKQAVNNKMLGVMDLIKQHNAGMTPMMNRYSPQSLPKYPSSMAESEPIKMIDNKTGKIWLADPSTKKFIGWGQ